MSRRYYYEDSRYTDPFKDYDFDNNGYPGEYVHGEDIYLDDYYMDELWKRVVGFPDYWVSDKGRVWSSKNQKFLKPFLMDNFGHYGVYLCNNGERRHKYIHRLMAEAFIPNENDFPVVRHLNDIPDDNDIENLRWGTNKDNTHDAIRNGTFRYLNDADREKAYKKCRKPIIAINTVTGQIKKYDGVVIAAKDLGISHSCISKVLTGLRDKTSGWTFEYVEEENYKYEYD